METRDLDTTVTTPLKAMRENVRNNPDAAVKYATAFNSIVTAIGRTAWRQYGDHTMMLIIACLRIVSGICTDALRGSTTLFQQN